MHPKYLSLLADPKTGEGLSLEANARAGEHVAEGWLISASNRYPIRRGIPRFVDDEGYSDNFGYQWNRWAKVQFESENVGRPMAGWTRSMFHKITEYEGDLSGQTVLDIGCGPGRFCDIALEQGATVVGLDYSCAIDAAAENLGDHENLLLVQGDALNMPFADGAFDKAFSIGVLHHTPDPYGGVTQAHRVLKPGGDFAIAVYGEGGATYDFPTVTILRKTFKALWPALKHYPALWYSYGAVCSVWPISRLSRLASLPFRVVFPIACLPDIRWSVLDTFDSVTPSYQSTHSSVEVYRWFKDAGYEDVHPTDWGFTSYRGRKRGAPATG
jgi:SAM-dependent methyltransferase